MPETNAKGQVIYVIRGANYDPAEVDIVDVLRIHTMFVDILMQENDNFMICGVAALMDMKGGTIRHFSTYAPVLVKKMMKIMQHAYPVRPKSLVYINTPSIFEFVLDLVKSFATEKLKRRVSVCLKIIAKMISRVNELCLCICIYSIISHTCCKKMQFTNLF